LKKLIRWLALLALATFDPRLTTVLAQLTFTTNSFNVGGHPSGLVAADVNGNGKLDLISANGGGDTLTVLMNTTLFPNPLYLSISSADRQIALWWLAGTRNFVLQSATSLPGTNWVAVTNGTPITNAAPLIGVTVTNASQARFFRLR
jgi:hypothetical protein